MATTFGLNATLRDVNLPSSKIKENQNYGRLRVCYDEVTFSSEPALNDLVNLMKLPKGAKVYDVVTNWAATAGTVGNIDLGWAASSDAVEAAVSNGFVVAASTIAAGTQRLSDNGSAGNAGLMKDFNAEVQVQLKINAATTGGAFNGKKFRVAVYYSV